MAIFSVVGYNELIAQQPGFLKDYPKFNEWLEQYSGLSTNNQEIVIDIVDALDIDVATGDMLDKLGELVGINRLEIILNSGLLLTDVYYRKVIKGKISQNSWDGTFEGYTTILDLVFLGTFQFVLIDNQDMSVDVIIFGILDAIDEELLLKGYYTPKAMGVDVDFFKAEPPAFGFDQQTIYVDGWDIGKWIEVL